MCRNMMSVEELLKSDEGGVDDDDDGYRVQPVAAGCIIGWDAAFFAADAVSPYQYTGAHFANLGRMAG